MKVSAIISNSGTITLVSRNKRYVISPTHINYKQIIKTLSGKDHRRIESLVNVKKAFKKIPGVTIKGGKVLFDGKPAHGVLVSRIERFIKEGLPYEPLVAFLKNLLKNPSKHSVDQLYSFLEHEGIPITPDGCFLGYKAIRGDWKDIHTGTISNKVGQSPSMKREDVDSDPGSACSRGLHVGAYSYAKGFMQTGGRMVLVKVNPADVVSVPNDHNAEKLRVCRYKVMAEAPDQPIHEAVSDRAEEEG